MSTPQEITTSITGLDPAQQEAVTQFMRAAVLAFEQVDPHALERMQHRGGPELGSRNTFEFNKGLMEGGDRIISWAARPYTQPRWSIMKLYQFHPAPTIWVDVMLSDKRRQCEYCFALAPGEDGALLSTYYIEREQKKPGASPSRRRPPTDPLPPARRLLS